MKQLNNEEECRKRVNFPVWCTCEHPTLLQMRIVFSTPICEYPRITKIRIHKRTRVKYRDMAWLNDWQNFDLALMICCQLKIYQKLLMYVHAYLHTRMNVYMQRVRQGNLNRCKVSRPWGIHFIASDFLAINCFLLHYFHFKNT